MKHFKTLFFSVFVLLAGALLFQACQKEETLNNGIQQKTISDYDLQINSAINSFRAKVDYIRKNPNFKSGESLSSDSAIWYLEASINYAHGFPNEYYEQMKTDTAYLTLTKNTDGSIDMNQLASKYDAMKSDVSNFYHNSGYSEKGLVFVDLTQENFKSDELIIQVVTASGERGVDPRPIPVVDGPFEVGDDWWYGEMGGKCDTPVIFDDAAHRLAYEMNNYISSQSGSWFFINQHTITKTGGELDIRRINDPDPPNNYLDYYLFNASEEYGTVTDNTLCLEWWEMNQHYNNLKTLLYNIIPGSNPPPGYSVIQIVSMIGDWETVNIYDMHYFHLGAFEYGYKIHYNADSGPSEID